MHRCACFTSVTVLFLWGTAHAGERSAAKTPIDLVASLVAAANRGDVEAFLSDLTASSRKALIQSFVDRASVGAEQQTFLKALDDRFGRGAIVIAGAESDMKSALASLASAEVLEDKPGPGGSAKLRVRTVLKGPDGKTASREDMLIARQEGGAWKLVLGFVSNGKRTAATKASIERVTKRVVEGQFRDRMSAMVALSNAFVTKDGAAP